MNNRKFLLENVIKFLFPFAAILVSYYLFNITDIIKPLDDIKDDKLKWAINLAFNTSVINILYELIKTTFKPSIEYDIKITDRKHQESIVLDFAEAEQLLALKCTISVRREKSINNTSSEIVIDYPKWLTLELDSIHHLDPAAFDHQQEKNELKINTSYLFNENIRDLETFIVPLKVIPRKINNYVGNIQVKINTTPRISSLFIRSKIKGFKIKIIEG